MFVSCVKFFLVVVVVCLSVFCLWRLSAPPSGRVYAVETFVAFIPEHAEDDLR